MEKQPHKIHFLSGFVYWVEWATPYKPTRHTTILDDLPGGGGGGVHNERSDSTPRNTFRSVVPGKFRQNMASNPT